MTELVVFQIGAHTLGLASEHVRELVRVVAVTPLAGAPPGVDGVIDLRGEIVPVFDLRARLGLPPRPVGRDDHMLVCTTGDTGVAIRTDRVLEIRAIAELAPSPPRATSDALVGALARLADGIVVICDLDAVLTAADREALARALADLPGQP